MTLNNLFGYNTLGRLIRFAPADVLAWLFPGGSSTTSDFNVRDLTANRDFHVGNIFSVLSETGVTHAQQLSVFGSPNGGRAQVEVQTVDGFQTTALQNWQDHDGDVICSVMPGGFAGPAPGITAVPASSLTGTVANARLDSKLAAFAASSVVFASQLAGAVADYDESTGTGTDNSAVFIAALAGGNVHLIVDGRYGVGTQIPVYSETTIEGLRKGDGFGKLGFGFNDGKSVFINAHPRAYGLTIVDYGIRFYNLWIDGNRRHGGCGQNAVTNFNASGYIVCPILIAGVDGLEVDGVLVNDSSAYAVFLPHNTNFLVHNLGHLKAAGDTNEGQAILGIEHGCSGGRVSGLWGTCTDDPIAFETPGEQDAIDNFGLVFFPPGVAAERGGPISDVVVSDCAFQSSISLTRFLSHRADTGITRVKVHHCSSTVTENGFYFDTADYAGDGTLGHYDQIELSNNTVWGEAAGVGFSAVLGNRARLGVIKVNGLVTDHADSALNLNNSCRALTVPDQKVELTGLTWFGAGNLPAVRNSSGGCNLVVDADFAVTNAESGTVAVGDGNTVPKGVGLYHAGSACETRLLGGSINTSASPAGSPVYTANPGLVVASARLKAGGSNYAIRAFANPTPVTLGILTTDSSPLDPQVTPIGVTIASNLHLGKGAHTLQAGSSDAFVSVAGSLNPGVGIENLVAGVQFFLYADAAGLLHLWKVGGADAFVVDASGRFVWTGLTADPHAAGVVWSNSGVLTVSAG